MTSYEYLRLCFINKMYLDRIWLTRVLSIPTGEKETKGLLPGFDGKDVFVAVDGEEVALTDYIADSPIFPINAKIDVDNEMLSCVTDTVRVTIGQLIINSNIIQTPFNGKIPFQEKELGGKRLDKLITNALTDDVITTDEYLSFMSSMNFITVYADFAITTFTPKTLQAAPDTEKVLKELLDKYSDQLNDPVIVALIDEAISATERAYLQGDPGYRFLKKGKDFDVVRKKIFGVQGGIPRLDDPSKMEYIRSSIASGIKPEELPAIINQLRSGSYDRGMSTAQGGEAAKFANRVFQNIKLAEEDCGTTIGKPETIKDNKELIGRYIVGNKTPLDEGSLTKLIGKKVFLRDPTGCKTKNHNYCGKCLGQNEVTAVIGLGPRLAEAISVFTLISLAMFHGTASKTVDYDPFEELI